MNYDFKLKLKYIFAFSSRTVHRLSFVPLFFCSQRVRMKFMRHSAIINSASDSEIHYHIMQSNYKDLIGKEAIRLNVRKRTNFLRGNRNQLVFYFGLK